MKARWFRQRGAHVHGFRQMSPLTDISLAVNIGNACPERLGFVVAEPCQGS